MRKESDVWLLLLALLLLWVTKAVPGVLAAALLLGEEALSVPLTPAAKQVAGDVQHMRRLVVGEVPFEHQSALVDLVDQSDPPGEQVHRPDPTRRPPTASIRYLVTGRRPPKTSALLAPATGSAATDA